MPAWVDKWAASNDKWLTLVMKSTTHASCHSHMDYAESVGFVCTLRPPTPAERTRIQNAIDGIDSEDPVCAQIKAPVQGTLDGGRLKMWDQPLYTYDRNSVTGHLARYITYGDADYRNQEIHLYAHAPITAALVTHETVHLFPGYGNGVMDRQPYEGRDPDQWGAYRAQSRS